MVLVWISGGRRDFTTFMMEWGGVIIGVGFLWWLFGICCGGCFCEWRGFILVHEVGNLKAEVCRFVRVVHQLCSLDRLRGVCRFVRVVHQLCSLDRLRGVCRFVRVVHQVCSLDRIRISRPNLIDWIRNNQQRQQLSRTNA